MLNNSAYATKPYPEAIAYFLAKINLGTDTWKDVANDQHDAFFVVAGAKGDLLSGIRAALDKAIATGQRPDEFRAEFEKIAGDWAGNKSWRANIIYNTNLKMSYGAGREQQQTDPDVVRLQPYRQFTHGGATHPRPVHIALDGAVFPAQDVPMALPNGYGCSCRYISLSVRSLLSENLEVSGLKRGDQIAGQSIAPEPGFDYAPGTASAARRDEIIEAAIARSPPTIAAQIAQERDRVNAGFANGSLSVRSDTPSWLDRRIEPVGQNLPITVLINGSVAPSLEKARSEFTKLGEGAFGEVYTDGAIAYKYGQIGKDELAFATEAAGLGVAPKVFGGNAAENFYAMEYLEGYQRLSAYKPADEVGRRINENTLKAFQRMHTNGIAHFDAHGGNIMVNPVTGDVKLIDFGFASRRPQDIRSDIRKLPGLTSLTDTVDGLALGQAIDDFSEAARDATGSDRLYKDAINRFYATTSKLDLTPLPSEERSEPISRSNFLTNVSVANFDDFFKELMEGLDG